MFASGGVSEILASAPMLDGHERGRVTVTITALPPFTSASRIAEHIQNAVTYYGKGPPYRPRSIDENGPAPLSECMTDRPMATRHWSLSGERVRPTRRCVASSTRSRPSTSVSTSSSSTNSPT